jgi:hypothetical protein
MHSENKYLNRRCTQIYADGRLGFDHGDEPLKPFQPGHTFALVVAASNYLPKSAFEFFCSTGVAFIRPFPFCVLYVFSRLSPIEPFESFCGYTFFRSASNQ